MCNVIILLLKVLEQISDAVREKDHGTFKNMRVITCVISGNTYTVYTYTLYYQARRGSPQALDFKLKTCS